jgi:hypothetical protein
MLTAPRTFILISFPLCDIDQLVYETDLTTMRKCINIDSSTRINGLQINGIDGMHYTSILNRYSQVMASVPPLLYSKIKKTVLSLFSSIGMQWN